MDSLFEILATLAEFFAFALLGVVVFYVSTVVLCCAADLHDCGKRFWHRMTSALHRPRHGHVPAWR